MNRTLQLTLHTIGLAEHPDRSPVPRSPHWSKFEDDFIREHPACIVCGNTKRKELTGHHVKSFHLHPDLELDPRNIRTMCRDNFGFICHRIFGHLGDYKLENPDVDDMAREWYAARQAAIHSPE